MECLEARCVLSVNTITPSVEKLWLLDAGALGSPSRVEEFQFSDSNRWSSTGANGGGLTQGQPTTLRWGIIPDGSAISSAETGESSAASNLISTFDGLYGVGSGGSDLTQRPWFSIFSSSFNRLGALSGLTYSYQAIVSAVSLPDGVASPEILVGGHSIDGQSGGNTLAYNYFPNGGDMVLDTDNTLFFGDSSTSSLRARNTLMHEAGHGVGISHVESSDGNFLMEQFASVAFDGPQLDDIQALQRGYGDALEKSGGNDVSATATNLGTISNGATVRRGTLGSATVVAASDTDFASIDDESDVDVFKFTVNSSGAVSLVLTPRGTTYQQGPQGGTQTSFNSAAQSDLTIQLLGTNGTTVLQTANVNGLGGSETISNFAVSAAGTYFARVSGATIDKLQLYGLDVSFSAATSGSLSISDASVTEGNSGTSTLTFQVTLSGAVSPGFTVRYATQDGTATLSDQDYVGVGASKPLVIGSFNSARGGIFSLSDGANAATMKSSLQTNFPGSTIVGTSTLTSTFLSGVDVLWLNSVSSNSSATAALTVAEQTALLNFVNAGGGVLIFGENGGFDDESLLDPFGATTTGVLTDLQAGTITNTTHVVTNGPFGAVRTIRGNYAGSFTALGSATSLGVWNSSGLPSVAVVDPGVLAPGSGRVVLFSDVNFYSDQLGAADNSKLVLNALSAVAPMSQLTFAGTAGETRTIQVQVNGDTRIEPGETLSVLLSQITGNSNVTIADGTGVGTILNDDIAIPPVITSSGGGASASINVPENTTAVVTVTATDVGDTLTYSISGGADAAKFVIDSTTGVLRFIAAPDFEAPTDANGDNVYQVTVTVRDSTNLTDSQVLSVTVTNVVIESVSLSIGDASVTEGNSGTKTLSFPVTLSSAASSGFTVRYATQDGTATVAGNDYVGIGGGGGLVIGAFNYARGGEFSLSNGANAAAVRTSIQTNFPGASFTGTSTLTSAFLSGINVLWLNSVSSNSSATLPLNAAEQVALLNFVNAGGGVMIFGENEAYDDESLLDPFGATTSGILTDLQAGTITNTTHVVTNGPFGTVRNIRGNYTGSFTVLGSATSLGTWDSSGLSSVAVVDPGVLSPGSGRVVLFSDVNFYSDQLTAADNSKLVLNALSAVAPVTQLTFAGTAGETHNIQVTINGDTLSEANETFNVLLSQLTGNSQVTILDGSGLGTILNDDAAPQAPQITSNGGGATASINVPENTTAVTTVTATDADVGDSKTFSLGGGADAAKFQIDSVTGVLRFVAAPDFEAPTDANTDNVYQVTVIVTDSSGLTDSQALSVSVTNQQATLSINDASVTEGNSGTSSLTFQVTLSAAVTPGFTVRFATQDGTATVSGNDYVPIGSGGGLVIGAFNASRGGIFSLSNGANAAAMRTSIQSNFSGATFVGSSTLTPAFLSGVDVLWLNSVSSNSTSTPPLSAAEQGALLSFVNAGGGVLIFGENGAYEDESLLDPFGATTSGVLTELQTGTITNTTHVVTNGPFGTVQTIRGNYSGSITTLGSATSLGSWNSSGQSSVAVVDPGVLAPGSGRVVLFSDVNLYSDQLTAADNSKLVLNALSAVAPSRQLTFTGTAGETHTITVQVKGDTQVEGNETLNVLLSQLNGNNDVTISDGIGAGTILNDDPPSVSIQNVRTLRGNIAEFTIVLSAPTQSTVTVAFATASGTAISGRDFVAAQGKLTFAPGETVKTIRVTTSNGSAASASNQFTIKLSRAVNALFANSRALGTILMDR